MRLNADTACCRPSLGVNILIAEDSIGPRPAGTDHQRLEVVLAGKKRVTCGPRQAVTAGPVCCRPL